MVYEISYVSLVFGNTVMAADEARTNTYGTVKEIPVAVGKLALFTD
jgi:hypothetical protein